MSKVPSPSTNKTAPIEGAANGESTQKLETMFSNVDVLITDKKVEPNNRILCSNISPHIIILLEARSKHCRSERTAAEYSLNGYDFIDVNLHNNVGKGHDHVLKKWCEILYSRL